MNVERIAQLPRQSEEGARGGEYRVDRVMRHAMIDDIEEPGALACPPDLRHDPVCGGGVAAEAGDVDRRNGRKVAHPRRHRLLRTSAF
jgi:hypothetical protein